jgi:uncharacterized protein YndB with AHSA1/START domain
MKTDIDLTMTYPHPVGRVWAALTSAEALAAWLPGGNTGASRLRRRVARVPGHLPPLAACPRQVTRQERSAPP